MEDTNAPKRSNARRLVFLMMAVAVALLGLSLWMTRVKHEPPQVTSSIEIAELRNLAIAHLENLNYAKADALLLRLSEAVPSEQFAFQNLTVNRLLAAQVENRKQDADEKDQLRLIQNAEEAVLKLLDRFPGSKDSRVLAARFAKLVNELPRAVTELELAVQAAPQDPAIAFELYSVTKDASDGGLVDRGKPYLKKAYDLAPQNMYLMTEFAQQQARDADPTLAETLQNAKPVLAPFVEKVKKFVRIDLNEHIDKTLTAITAAKDDKDWGPIRANVAILVNVLRPEVARQLDEKRVSKHLLEFVAYDFSAAYYSANKKAEIPQSEPISVKLVSQEMMLPGDGLKDARDLRLCDFNLDGKIDLCVVQASGLTVFGPNANNQWTEIAVQSLALGTRGAAFLDMDRDRNTLTNFKTPEGGEVADSSLDVVTWGASGLQVWKNGPSKDGTRVLTLMPQSEVFGAIKDVLTVLPVDFDHDGDLDLVVSAKNGLTLWINRDDFTFGNATAYSALPPADLGIQQMIAVDWNRNVSIDVVCLSENGAGVLENVLHSQFRWQPFTDDVAQFKGATSMALIDADSNFSWDLVLGGAKSVDYVRTTNPDSGVTHIVGQRSIADAPHCKVLEWDYDNDGLRDVLILRPGIDLQNYRGGPDGQFTRQESMSIGFDGDFTAVDIEDVDGDGDLDIVALKKAGIAFLVNEGGNTHKSLRLPIRAEDAKEAQRPNERVNILGIGSLVELKAGPSYVPQVVTRQWTHFGLGQRQQADALRVLWTNGVPENFIEPRPGQTIGMQQKLKGSCPYLYAWDGKKMAFFTDCLWAAPVGLQFAEGVVAPTRDWEYLKIDGDRLQPKNDEYVLSLTEELWEIGYIDSVRLLAIDHPAEVEVFSNEKVGPASLSEFKVHTVNAPKTPLAAVDQRGRDVLPLIAKRDDQFLRAFDRRIKQGLTEPHHVELSLGDLKNAKQIKLFLTGWMKPTDTSLNIAISQRPDLEPTQPPSIWVPDAQGDWQQASPFMGFPGGKTKTIVVDLSDVFLTNDYRIRIATTMELYWDQIFFTVDEAAAEIHQTEMPLVAADLRYRGFSKMSPHPQFGPEHYDYSQLAPLTSWPPLDGRLTAYGRVTGLVATQDNRQVTLGAGDELQLRFKVSVDLPKGWKRDFILHNVGWDKDADLNTIYGQTVDPLPYVGMHGYPDPAGMPSGALRPFADQTRQQDRNIFWRKFSFDHLEEPRHTSPQR